jgi:hypothetical protein
MSVLRRAYGHVPVGSETVIGSCRGCRAGRAAGSERQLGMDTPPVPAASGIGQLEYVAGDGRECPGQVWGEAYRLAGDSSRCSASSAVAPVEP